MIAEWLENQDDDVTVDALGNAMWKVCCEMFGQTSVGSLNFS